MSRYSSPAWLRRSQELIAEWFVTRGHSKGNRIEEVLEETSVQNCVLSFATDSVFKFWEEIGSVLCRLEGRDGKDLSDRDIAVLGSDWGFTSLHFARRFKPSSLLAVDWSGNFKFAAETIQNEFASDRNLARVETVDGEGWREFETESRDILFVTHSIKLAANEASADQIESMLLLLKEGGTFLYHTPSSQADKVVECSEILKCLGIENLRFLDRSGEETKPDEAYFLAGVKAKAPFPVSSEPVSPQSMASGWERACEASVALACRAVLRLNPRSEKARARLDRANRRLTGVEQHDVVVVGLGPNGIQMLREMRASAPTLRVLGIDAGPVLASIKRLPRWFQFASDGIGSLGIKLEGKPYKHNMSLHEFIEYFEGELLKCGAPYRSHLRVVDLSGEDGDFVLECRPPTGQRVRIASRKVVFATGIYSQPNTVGVPGEDARNVSHYLPAEPNDRFLRHTVDTSDGNGNGVPERYPAMKDKRVLIVGGRNSGALALLNLYRHNEIHWVCRPENVVDWIDVRWREEIRKAIESPNVTLYPRSELISLTNSTGVFTSAGTPCHVPFDQCYMLTGYRAANEFFRRVIGLKYEDRMPGYSVNPYFPPHNLYTMETTRRGVYIFGAIAMTAVYHHPRDEGPQQKKVYIVDCKHIAPQVVGDIAEKLGADAPRRTPSAISFTVNKKVGKNDREPGGPSGNGAEDGDWETHTLRIQPPAEASSTDFDCIDRLIYLLEQGESDIALEILDRMGAGNRLSQEFLEYYADRASK